MLKFLFSRFAPALLLATFSCTNVYFENPVPQKAEALSTVPDALPGLYEFVNHEERNEDNAFEQFKNCILIEKAGESQLLISWEARLHERDLPALKARLESKKAAGEISNYTLTDHFLLCTVMVPVENDTRHPQQQFISLTKEGSWYVVSQTRQPFMLLDFKTGTSFALSAVKSGNMSGLLPEADSLEMEPARLAARSKDGGYYFNREKTEVAGWELMCLLPRAGGWLLKTSDVAKDKEFRDRLGDFNKITPFEKIDESKYRIHPNDDELARLLEEKDLFYAAELRRLEP